MNYKVIRSKRKTLCMRFEGDGLVVRAPLRLSEKRIADFVMRHRAWIEKHAQNYLNRPHFSNGEKLEIAGKSFTIAEGERARQEGSTLYLPATGRQEALIGFLRNATRVRMKGFLDSISKEYGFCYTRLAVTSARRRWGSCSSSGHISFSFRSAFLPDELAYYLAVHELCHTRFHDHSPRFWAEVEKILPDYKSLRAGLKGYLWATECL